MPPGAEVAPSSQPYPALAASAALFAVGGVLAANSWRATALFVIGVALGGVLVLSTFSFAAAHRQLLLWRRGEGALGQLLMLVVATAIFAPALAAGELYGTPLSGSAAPLGVSVAVGAFMFGVGMQLAGGCGSGTLFALGSGSARMGLVLLCFCAGGFAASLSMPWWESMPSLPPIVLGQSIGWPEAAALQIAFIALLSILLRRQASASFSRLFPRGRQWISGPWPLAFGAMMLALLNLATLLVAGHPWSITWAFTLWGAKSARMLGWQPASDSFWTGEFQSRAIGAGILEDVTSIMDIGTILGALFAAGLAGRFLLRWRLAPRPAIAALLGGVLMGYGARIAYGCNIGAFFSGVASTSLHGWLWIAAALAGSAAGIRLRPLFALSDGLPRR